MSNAVSQQSVRLMSLSNIYPHDSFVTQDMRNRRQGYRSGMVWLTGISQSNEDPQDADLVLDTSRDEVDACSRALLAYFDRVFRL